MNYIVLILSSIILPIISSKHIATRLCINCKHFIMDNGTGKFGKCSLFPKEENKITLLVNGLDDTINNEYHYCLSVRQIDHMCGEEGKYYRKRYTKSKHNMHHK